MKINFKAIPEAMKVIGKALERNKSTILVGAGLVGWIGTAVLVAKAAPKAKTAIDKLQRDCNEQLKVSIGEKDEEFQPVVDLSPIAKIKATWQYYIPAAGLGVVSSAAIVYAHKLDLTKVASLMSTYQLTKGELKQLKDKIVEKDGEEKLKEYEKDVHKDVLVAASSDNIYNTGKGLSIFYDPTTGMKFYSDYWKVETALKHVIKGCEEEGMYSLSDLRYELGLPRNEMEEEWEFVWDTVKNIDEDHIPSYFYEYHGNDLENGDSRACVWLCIKDYLVYRKDSFR